MGLVNFVVSPFMRRLSLTVGIVLVIVLGISLMIYLFCIGYFLRPPGLINITKGWNIEGEEYLHLGQGTKNREFYHEWLGLNGFKNQSTGEYISTQTLNIFGYQIERVAYVAGGDSNFVVGYSFNVMKH